jgi:hypothetical protein
VRDAAAIVLALACGVLLASYDTRTDDTGIELGLLLIASLLLALLAPKRWWAIALLVGGFIPIVEISAQWGSGRVPPGVVAVVVTFAGALGGLLIARASGTKGPAH